MHCPHAVCIPYACLSCESLDFILRRASLILCSTALHPVPRGFLSRCSASCARVVLLSNHVWVKRYRQLVKPSRGHLCIGHDNCFKFRSGAIQLACSRKRTRRSSRQAATVPWTTYSLTSSFCWLALSQALVFSGKSGMKSLRSQRGLASLFACVVATVVVGGLCTCVIVGNLQVCL